MSRKFAIQSVMFFMVLTLAGCAGTTGSGGGIETRAYIADKQRVDQNMEGGNFGYINGTPKQPDLSKMSKSRKVYVLEFTKNPDVTVEDLRKGAPAAQPVTIDVPERSAEESSAYESPDPVIIENIPSVKDDAEQPGRPTEYVVQKDDTLQKISKKIYGTYKKWYSIYEANKDILSDPNRIKPGLTIRIP